MLAAKRTPVNLEKWCWGMMEHDNRKSHLIAPISPSAVEFLKGKKTVLKGVPENEAAVMTPRDQREDEPLDAKTPKPQQQDNPSGSDRTPLDQLPLDQLPLDHPDDEFPPGEDEFPLEALHKEDDSLNQGIYLQRASFSKPNPQQHEEFERMPPVPKLPFSNRKPQTSHFRQNSGYQRQETRRDVYRPDARRQGSYSGREDHYQRSAAPPPQDNGYTQQHDRSTSSSQSSQSYQRERSNSAQGGYQQSNAGYGQISSPRNGSTSSRGADRGRPSLGVRVPTSESIHQQAERVPLSAGGVTPTMTLPMRGGQAGGQFSQFPPAPPPKNGDEPRRRPPPLHTTGSNSSYGH